MWLTQVVTEEQNFDKECFRNDVVFNPARKFIGIFQEI